VPTVTSELEGRESPDPDPSTQSAPADGSRSGVDGGFRPDIQGLRGIAILVVVLFHADVVFSGGFVGVDVFFVVSGFVIATLLANELERSGRIDLGAFYARRVRRLLPASVLATTATLVGAVVVLSPDGPQQATAQTALASSFFAANLQLYRSGNDYFGPADVENPLLHMWTLSVEEQFYIVLPLLLLVVWLLARRLRVASPRRATTGAVVGVAVASGLVSWALLAPGRLGDLVEATDRLAFYSPVSRAWEFCAGVLLALGWERVAGVGRRVGAGLGVLGLAAVLGSSARLDAATPFPGLAALWPVLGTVALLVAGWASPSARAVLGWAPLRWVGDRSYGWYLWHWPMIVLTREVWPGRPGLVLVAAALSLVPAALSFHFVERPIRSRRTIEGRKALALGLACTLAVVGVAVGVRIGASTRWGLEEEPSGWQDTRLAVTAGCGDEHGVSVLPPECTFRVDGSTGTILLIGDSHAASAADGVVAAGHRLGYDVAVWYQSGCPFLRDRPTFGVPTCPEDQEDAFAIVEGVDPDLVVVANRSPGYTLSDVPGGGDDWRTISLEDGSKARSQDDALRSWGEGLDGMFRALEEDDIPVVLFLVVPEYLRRFVGPTLLDPTPDRPRISLDELDEVRGDAIRTEQEVARRYDDVSVFDPAPSLCGAESCTPVHRGEWRYKDASHLNPRGSAVLVDPLVEVLGAALPGS
jgi:peptidoglycan/LPS O-acetylase OafA/YrhL